MPTETIGVATYVSEFGGDAVQVNQPSFPKRKEIYDLASASMRYEGAPSRISDYADSLSIGDILEYLNQVLDLVTLETMFLASVSQNEGAYNSELILSFIGTLDGNAPPQKIEDSLCQASTTTVATITDPSSPLYTEDGDGNPTTKLSGTVEYKSARTFITWFTFAEPDENVPEFSTVSNTTPPLDRPFTLRINANNQGGSPSTIDLADVIDLFNTLSAETHVEDYKPKALIPGLLWECSVCVQYVIVGAS